MAEAEEAEAAAEADAEDSLEKLTLYGRKAREIPLVEHLHMCFMIIKIE